jgi:hypothetical protein
MHVLRNGLVALGVMAASCVVGASPVLAAAKGPQVPAGCSLNKTTGVLTCSTTTTTKVSEGPFNTLGASIGTSGIVEGTVVSTSTAFGDFTGTQICMFENTATQVTTRVWTEVALTNVVVNGVITTTGTTQRHGLNGKVFATSTSTSLAITSLTGGSPYGEATFEVACQSAGLVT